VTVRVTLQVFSVYKKDTLIQQLWSIQWVHHNHKWHHKKSSSGGDFTFLWGGIASSTLGEIEAPELCNYRNCRQLSMLTIFYSFLKFLHKFV